MMSDRETTLITVNIPNVENQWTTRYEMLLNDQYFFYLGDADENKLRAMESNFGMLPSPKLNEAQDYYRHLTTTVNTPLMLIPISASDIATVGFIQEALSYESYYSFLPEYYTDLFEIKVARDEETVEILKIIHESIYYELSGVMVYNEIPYQLQEAARYGEGAETLVSKFTANVPAADAKIAGIIENFK